MNRLRYEMRGVAYWMECANPLRRTVTARDLPLGIRIEAYKRDCVGRGLYRRGVHEAALTKFFLDTFSNAPSTSVDGANVRSRHFLDVGANIGYFSCLFGRLAGPGGSVIAVEPEAQNLRLLERNLAQNGLRNVKVRACAVGAVEGTARLGIYKPANRGRHSLVDLRSCEQFVEVPVRRLDDVLRGEGVAGWDVLKLDVEGFEPFVFQGASETLSRTEILAMEFSPALWRGVGIEPSEVFQMLTAKFSRVYRFEGMTLSPLSVADCLRIDKTTELVLRR